MMFTSLESAADWIFTVLYMSVRVTRQFALPQAALGT